MSPKFNYTFLLCALAIGAIVAFVSAEPKATQFKHCPEEPNITYACDVHEIRIDPCLEASKGKPCKIRQNYNASITIDFTPRFASSDLFTQFYGSLQGITQAFRDIDTTDGCAFTTCPTVSGQVQSFSYGMHIAKKYPVGIFPVRWVLQSGSNQCCALFQVKIGH